MVKDYIGICDSYYEALRGTSPSQIEAVDMGRRGLHNEGAELLKARLDGKIAIDHETARRLFTLICALHWRGWAMTSLTIPRSVLFACRHNLTACSQNPSPRPSP